MTPTFQARHYKLLAKVFADTRDQCGGDWGLIRSHLHKVLAKDNPNFDSSRFLDACYNGRPE